MKAVLFFQDQHPLLLQRSCAKIQHFIIRDKGKAEFIRIFFILYLWLECETEAKKQGLVPESVKGMYGAFIFDNL